MLLPTPRHQFWIEPSPLRRREKGLSLFFFAAEVVCPSVRGAEAARHPQEAQEKEPTSTP